LYEVDQRGDPEHPQGHARISIYDVILNRGEAGVRDLTMTGIGLLLAGTEMTDAVVMVPSTAS
jgi:hypothetical protein